MTTIEERAARMPEPEDPVAEAKCSEAQVFAVEVGPREDAAGEAVADVVGQGH